MAIMRNRVKRICVQALLLIIAAAYILGLPSSLYAMDQLLIIRPEERKFEEVQRVIVSEVEEEFVIKEFIITPDTSHDQFIKKMKNISPRLVVLMDNRAFRMFEEYKAALPDGTKPIPSILCMGVFINKVIDTIKNSTGVTYEVPPVASIVSFRTLSKKPIKKVGVIHRPFINLQQDSAYCKREDIELICYHVLKTENYKKYVKEGFKHLVKKEKIDALWIANDSILLKLDIIKDVWLPMIAQYKIPVIVCVENLINPRINFGTFAVLPSHEGIGMQVAEMIFEIKDRGWNCEGLHTIPPISIYKILNLPMAEKYMDIEKEKLRHIDKILD